MVKTLLARTGVLARVRQRFSTEIGIASRPLRKDLARLARAVDQVAAQQQALLDRVARVERETSQFRAATRLDAQQRDIIATLDRRLDAASVVAHVRRAIEEAPLQREPFPHIVVERLLPDDVYQLVLEAIPPATFFNDRDPVKQNIRVPMEFGPTLTLRIWDLMDRVVARDGIRPAVLQKFEPDLARHYDTIFGAPFRDRARALPQAVSGGRLMLRQAGYHLDPHRDPKRALLTCLIYLARPHDDEAFGTQIFRVEGDHEATYTETYYPERAGAVCTLVKTVPFRPNAALVFLNSSGAHGADIPATASRKVARYAFQFYVGPGPEALESLIAELPRERQAMWRKKSEAAVQALTGAGPTYPPKTTTARSTV
jgi:hypothetical protein